MKAARNGSPAYSGRGFDGRAETQSSHLPPSFGGIASGADQAGVRAYNERLLLTLVRRFGPLSKIEVARLTGLSVQSTSAIMNWLQADGLLKREAPLRGRVGQPTVPMSLEPEGAYALGLKIGRRSCDLVLIDFRGAVRRRAAPHLRLSHPGDGARFRSLLAAAAPRRAGRRATSADRRTRRRLAVPAVDMGSGNRRPAGAMAAWRDFDGEREIAKVCPCPVVLCNDASAACAAEFFFGKGWRYRDFLYFFVGAFIGGGLVLDGSLRLGRTGNAGALGSMPVMAKSEGGLAPQLIACASIYQLERRLERAGINASSIWATPDAWADFGSHLDAWIEEVASALAYASVAAISVVDFEAIVIDGAMPPTVRNRLTARTSDIFRSLDRRGLSEVEIASGSVGADARAIGAAALPLIKNFARDREVLFKDAASQAG